MGGPGDSGKGGIMKITIESTTKTVQVAVSQAASLAGDTLTCRVWEGTTESGIKVQCLIPRIAAHKDNDLSQFEAELTEQRAPSSDFEAFPLRMII